MPKTKKQPVTQKKITDVTVMLAGEAGQGLVTIEKILTAAVKRDGLYVFASSEYMSRVRGGVNSTTIRVAGAPVAAPVERVDFFVPLVAAAYDRYRDQLTAATHVIGDSRIVALCGTAAASHRSLGMDLAGLAAEAGDRLYANTVAAGAILALLGVDRACGEDVVTRLFLRKGQSVVDGNIAALGRGYKAGEHVSFLHGVDLGLVRSDRARTALSLSGSDAIGLGALAAGVNFCTSYPMSPSTGVLTFLAQHGKECDVVVEQATDEIGAINMSLGASYAGARPLVTTAGGGFALMEEAVSLAGMTETPITIHVAQRPGPATGLPTRTAQEDLQLVRYAGHGDFARAIYAPGTVAQAFVLTQRAVDMAHRYQMPTFILSDQHLVDSLALADSRDFPIAPFARHIVPTEVGYKRYTLGGTGVSPRGVPGYGDGYVCADSDEHDEDGRITEEAAVRVAMTAKRMKRMAALRRSALLPTWTGPRDAAKVLVVWGSTGPAAVEALAASGRDDVAVAHFTQVYPVNPRVAGMFAGVRAVTVAEGNLTGQFADLLQLEAGIVAARRVPRYDGSPFTVEVLTDVIRSM